MSFWERQILLKKGPSIIRFFNKWLSARNPVVIYRESIRIAYQCGAIEQSVVLLFATVPEPEYATFAKKNNSFDDWEFFFIEKIFKRSH